LYVRPTLEPHHGYHQASGHAKERKHDGRRRRMALTSEEGYYCLCV
jgi:hypothetical protein